MNILVAPNSMKGSLNADEFASAVEKGLRKVSPVFNVRSLPIADGGDYTGQVLMKALTAREITCNVSDPLGRPVRAEMGISGKTAVIEMSAASGMRLLSSNELNPDAASTAGTGEMLRHALGLGCTSILLGVGGSATIDGGIGMLGALGFIFTDSKGGILQPVPASLQKVADIHPPADWNPETRIIILYDVKNPLLGPEGAASVFGPQKGADAETVQRLELGLSHWVKILEEKTGKQVQNVPGMGAAGGIASGLYALLNARMVPGAEYIFNLLNLDEHLEWADWVITGEGKIDGQSNFLKAPVSLALAAKNKNKPVMAIAGAVEYPVPGLFSGVFSIACRPMSLKESLELAGDLVAETASQTGHLILRASQKDFADHVLVTAAERLINENRLNEAQLKLQQIDRNLAAYPYLNGLISKKLQNWGSALNGFLKALEIDPGFRAAESNIQMVRNIISFINPALRDP